MKRLVLVKNNLRYGSAKKLAETLGSTLGYKVFRVTSDRIGRRIPFYFRGGTDKLTQLNRFKDEGIPCPDFTVDRNIALGWINVGDVVMCRTLLRASEGRGIVIADTPERLINAPLYTKYFKKKREYRVHVLNGNVIDVQEKRKRRGVDERNTKIRNLANGYVFCRNEMDEPEGLRALAVRATKSLNYNLGAVDIAFNERYNQLIVLEVNATPGMQGSTLNKYSDSIINWYKEQQRNGYR